VTLHPYYFVSVTCALLLLFFFPVTRHLRERSQRRDYWTLQLITILGALFGAKISALMGDFHWPFQAAPDWPAIFTSGRSITGALIGGFLAAELAKPLLNYTMPPNDRFAAVLPFSIGMGRIGCALTGCCLGAPYNGWCAVAYSDGIPRHPAQIYEAIFQFSCGIAFMWMARKQLLFGRIFALYLVIYGVFRVFTENLRATPKDWFGLSAYQWLSMLMIALGAAFLVKRTLWQPASWRVHFQNQQTQTEPS
jgi:phosphatidylglycerol:prolipoprotein diacylglycerol transferase